MTDPASQGFLFDMNPARKKKKDPLVESVVQSLRPDQLERWTQLRQVLKTCKTADLFSHPLKKGWLFQYLIWSDAIFTRRWVYWQEVIQTQGNPDNPPPPIDFQMPLDNVVHKHLREMMDYSNRQGYSSALEDFAAWLLWGFGDPTAEFPTKLTEDVSRYWYQNFKLPLIHQFPADYMAELASEYYGSRAPNGFFPTPMNVCTLMAKMQFGDDWKANLKASVCDPCAGTGSMLLAASNFSVNLYAIDINPLLVKLCRINLWLFAPWAIWMAPEEGFGFRERVECRNALIL